MSFIPKIPRGEDEAINIRIFSDEAQTTAVPISGLTDIWVFIDVDGVVIAKYSLNSLSGYDDVSIVNSAEGRIQVRLEQKHTETAKIGYIGIEVKTEQADALYEDGDFKQTRRVEAFAELIDAKSKLL